VLALTRYDRLGPSSRLRILQFVPALRQFGIVVTVDPLLQDSQLAQKLAGRRYRGPDLAWSYLRRLWTLRGARQYDLIWVQKEAFPWLPAFTERFPGLLRVPYVVDYDDPTFHSYNQHPKAIVRAALGAKIADVMRHAAAVVVGNAYLAQYARAAGAKSIVEIPTVVDVARYQISRSPRATGPIRIGWIGTPSTSRYLDDIAPSLRQLMRRKEAKLVVVGAPHFSMAGVSSEARQWHESSEVAAIQSFDVGVMPLRDTPFARGKCGYKLIQYMACGLPTVASPVGANATIVDHGRTGFLATTQGEWLDRLSDLARDANLRAHLGQAGREKAVALYSLERATPVLAEVLRQAAT
jgi:glycosyltransferase involved in cell wall biosynthesis